MAVLICLISVLAVLRQINNTSVRLQAIGPGAFNYVWQTDRSLDTFTAKLEDYLQAANPEERQKLWKEVRLRFDLVWSTLSILDVRVPGSLRPLKTSLALKQAGTEFLKKSDLLYSSKTPPADTELKAALLDMRVLQGQAHQVGLELFHTSTGLHDEVSDELDSLYKYLWISGVFLLLTATTFIFQLFRAMTRSRQLFKEARTSQEQLERVVEELRSGRLEQKAKDSFLAAASHDLRQPLHALGLFVNALENKVTLPDGPIILDKIKQSTEALSSLFNSLLDISRLDAGVVEVSTKHFDIGDLFNHFREEFEEVASARNLGLSVKHTNEIAYTDPVLLSRILRNLIDNAIVHSRAGYIEVSCNQKNRRLEISVSDTGPGIPMDEQSSIFSEYYQLDNPERDRTKGLGLGLSIVKRLSELLELKLALKSESGVGTTFSLSIPVGQISKIETDPDNNAMKDGDLDLKGALVLVIDDEQDVREGMELMLRQVNCTVMTTESGETARETIVSGDLVPQVIIADYRLREGKTGIEAIDLLREEINHDIPALIVTGDTSPERVREVSASGMKLLHKPVKPNELIAVVKSMLNGCELSQLDRVS